MVRVEFENVDFGYKNGGKVLHDINLDLEGPGLYCIIGPNGVGKSTLIKCINKINKPTAGKVRINGRDISEMKQMEIAHIVGYVPATNWDVFSMPVIDTIMVGRTNKQKWGTRPEDLEIVHRAMAMLDLEDLAMRGFNELSAGQHQRVALARGLVQETEILLLDEPTANLDVKHQVYVTELLKAIADVSGKQIIMICHDLNIAARYADRIIVMGPPGVVYGQGKAEDVIKSDMIMDVYGIDSEVITFEDKPYVLLRST
ncbi:MAG: ABC transporter ATP-binding protein, partial [archaeon]|nr:ABC transporter ATP-binding protein [archaeon]